MDNDDYVEFLIKVSMGLDKVSMKELLTFDLRKALDACYAEANKRDITLTVSELGCCIQTIKMIYLKQYDNHRFEIKHLQKLFAQMLDAQKNFKATKAKARKRVQFQNENENPQPARMVRQSFNADAEMRRDIIEIQSDRASRGSSNNSKLGIQVLQDQDQDDQEMDNIQLQLLRLKLNHEELDDPLSRMHDSQLADIRNEEMEAYHNIFLDGRKSTPKGPRIYLSPEQNQEELELSIHSEAKIDIDGIFAPNQNTKLNPADRFREIRELRLDDTIDNIEVEPKQSKRREKQKKHLKMIPMRKKQYKLKKNGQVDYKKLTKKQKKKYIQKLLEESKGKMSRLLLKEFTEFDSVEQDKHYQVFDLLEQFDEQLSITDLNITNKRHYLEQLGLTTIDYGNASMINRQAMITEFLLPEHKLNSISKFKDFDLPGDKSKDQSRSFQQNMSLLQNELSYSSNEELQMTSQQQEQHYRQVADNLKKQYNLRGQMSESEFSTIRQKEEGVHRAKNFLELMHLSFQGMVTLQKDLNQMKDGYCGITIDFNVMDLPQQ